ncbi:MAG: OmpA family protein [Cyclobacteriaceae bacterium]|nr:OmpA family protein [Cyclobacteriaceae bacterium]
MKKTILLTLIALSTFSFSPAQNTLKELPSGYFMVLAAYAPSAEQYAINYTENLKKKGIDAQYGFSYSKELYFVYSKHYTNRTEAIGEINSERQRTGEDRAWVYVYKAQNLSQATNEEMEKPAEKEKVIIEIPEETGEEDTEVAIDLDVPEKDEPKTKQVIAGGDTLTIRTDIPVSHQGLTYLHVEATDARTGEPLNIDFNVIDLAHNTFMESVTSNKSYPVKEPNSASKMIQVQSDDIGYEKQSFDFEYYTPIIDSANTVFLDNLGDTTFVKFEMSPLKKGDIVTLYKVYFYKDAAIMMDKSQYELDQLVTMLKNNPKQKIVIHGHTNGNAAGTVIALKDHDDVDFFNLNGDHKETGGSAKELSYERATSVGRYLEYRGIDPSRFKIEGWGGKKMIYDKHSQQARFNVRVEVEVVED